MPDNAPVPQGTAVAARDTSPVGQFQRQLETRARDIGMALPGHITQDKFQRTVLTAVAQNPDLLKADRQSLILACYKAAQDALLPDGRESAFVTFSTRKKIDGQWKSLKLVQYMPMVYGLRKKILQSAEVVSLEVNVVYKAEVEKGTFLYEVGLEPPLRHRPSLDLTGEETTDDQIVAAYSIATMKDGTKSYEIMRRFEIDKVRQTSQTGAVGQVAKYDMGDIKKGQPVPPKGPWVDWFAEMAKKTVMRRHAKTLPMSGDVLIDIEDRELERGVSTAAALASDTPDEPLSIEDQTGVDDDLPAHDPETGEITDEDANVTGGDTSAGPVAETAKAEPEKKAASGRGKAKAEPKPEPDEQPEAEEPQEPTLAEEARLDPAGEAEAGEHPGEAIADKIIAEINDPATNAILDVGTILNRNQLDMAAMLDEDAVRIEIAADRKRAQIREVLARAKAHETESAE